MAAPVLIAATALQAVGAIRQGQAAAGAANYNAAIADQNAQIADSQSYAAVQAQQRSAAKAMGASIAAFGASGVAGDSGSALDVLADSARQSSLDAATIKYNYDLRKTSYQQQATLDRYNAKNSLTAGYLNAAAGLASGGGQAIPMLG